MLKKIKSVFTNQYAFSLITKVFNVLIGVIYTVFQARFLGSEIKGQVATVNSIVSVVAIVFSFGICQAYPYFKKKSEKDLLSTFMHIALVMLGIYVVIDGLVIAFFSLEVKYIAVLIVSPFLVYDNIVSNIVLVDNPNRRHLTDAIVMVIELLLVIVFWLFVTPNFWLGVIVITVKDVTKAVIFTWHLRKSIFCKSLFTKQFLWELLKFGFFPMCSLLMATLNYRVDVIMLDGKVPDASIGIYSVGVMIAERVWMIPDALKGVLTSKLAKGKDASEVSYVIRICNTVCLCMIAGILLLGRPLINLLFGAEYSGSYEITRLLLIGAFSMIYYKTIAAYNIVMGRQIRSFVLLSVSVVANIILNALLIPNYGINGAGFASIASYTLAGILFAADFCTHTHQSFLKMIIVSKSDVLKIKNKLLKKKD